jgi:hypothetical protein
MKDLFQKSKKEIIFMKKILHISQTNINFDSRILKEFISQLDAGYIVFGVGICTKGGDPK